MGCGARFLSTIARGVDVLDRTLHDDDGACTHRTGTRVWRTSEVIARDRKLVLLGAQRAVGAASLPLENEKKTRPSKATIYYLLIPEL